jgi:outer membrane protein assembly factor BamB
MSVVQLPGNGNAIMNRVTVALLVALFGFAVRAPAQQAQLPIRARLYSQPVTPPTELLDRLNLKMRFRTFVPMDGRHDGLATVQLSGNNLFVQTRSGLVTMLDAETGAALWRQRVGRTYVVEHALAFNSREIYVVNNVYLYGLDRLTGAVNWEFRLPEGVATAPVADENVIFVPTQTGRLNAYLLPRPDLLAATPIRDGGRSGRPIAALREGRGSSTTVSHLTPSAREATTTGEVIGPQPTILLTEVTSARLELPIILTSDRLVVPTPNGTVLGMSKLRQSNRLSAVAYRFSTQSPIRAAAGYINGVAYIGGDDANLYALETAGGRLVWRYTVGLPITRRPAATNEDIYIVAGRQGMTRLDRETAQPLWRIPTRDGVAESNAAADFYLASNPKYVYALDSSGHFLVLDRRRGITLSGFDSRDFVYPISNDITDRVYLAANNGLIVCMHDREYTRAIRHRRQDEELNNPVRLRLDQRITDNIGTRETPLDEMLASWTKRYPPLRFRIEEDVFRAAGRELPTRATVRTPPVRDRRLGDVLRDMLASIQCIYEIIGDTVVILPAPAAAPEPER